MKKREQITHLLQKEGGLTPLACESVSRATGIPEAAVYGVGTFFHLLAKPETKVRVCQGLVCRLSGSEKLLAHAKNMGLPAEGCSCLAACDKSPAALCERSMIFNITSENILKTKGDWKKLSKEVDKKSWLGSVGPLKVDPEQLTIHLRGEPDFSGRNFEKASRMGAQAVLKEMEASGLQGRGGAAFPTGIKWNSIYSQKEKQRFVVLNGDEGEPGTFKDREILIRRPDLVLEGLAIAAMAIGAREIYCYLRGEFEQPIRSLHQAITKAKEKNLYPKIDFLLHSGHGSYICGEETSLLETLEGRRGMPRIKPPFPTERGLWGKPTLIQNVETIACVPAIIQRGPHWFKSLGKTEPGTKLYCISGHVKIPGTYELPLGSTLEELVETAGGYEGDLKAFSPGGASSGFLPARERNRPLDWASLKEIGSSLGSAGVVVLNQTTNIAEAVRHQLEFYEHESCGQCAPCRIGIRFQRKSLERLVNSKGESSKNEEKHIKEIAWEMNEGSICGLGQIASGPLISALKWFPEDFNND